MRLMVGTSGYSYKEWKGTFYPSDLPASKMLAFYATQFDAVEINNTAYQMPRPPALEKWASEVPDGFTFVLKTPKRITHLRKLDAPADVRQFLDVASVLGPKLGPLLVPTPDDLPKNVDVLRRLLALIPRDRRVAFDFRHDSWNDDEVFAVLREHDAALCASDTDEVTDPSTLIVPTASWGYVRLRRSEYDDAALAAWRTRIEAQPWSDAYVFFRHEDEGKGVGYGRGLLKAN
jgi:uncharacterized protein YecE (DUF72 family)